MVPAPSFAHFGSGYPELDAGGTGMFKMSVQGGAGDPGPVHILEEEVDGLRAAAGLFFLQLNSLFDHLGAGVARLSLITAFFSRQVVKSPFLVALQLPTQGGNRGRADTSVRISELL